MLGFYERMAIEDRINACSATNDDAARLLRHMREQDRHIDKLASTLADSSVIMSGMGITLAEAARNAEHVASNMARLRSLEQITD